MNAIFIAVITGFVWSVPLTAMVGLALRIARNTLNAATRYGVWWAALAVVTALPVLYLPTLPSRGAKASALPPGLESPLGVRAFRPASASPEPILKIRANPPQIPGATIAVPQTEWPQRLAELWAISAFLMLCRLTLSLIMLQIQRRKATDAPAALAALMTRCLARCGVKRHARIAVVNKGGSPLVTGPIRPCILIPAHLLQAIDDEMEQICLHEAAHLARFDDCALLLQRFVEALAVFHPVVRWIARQIDLEREIACDDFVIALTGNARAYASCLTHVAELSSGYRSSPAAATVADESSHLNRRIDMLLNNTRRTGTKVLKTRFTTALAALALITWLAGKSPALLALAAPMQAAISKPAAQSASAVQTPTPKVPSIQPVSRPPAAHAVRLLVTVTDPLNRYVTGLDKSAFRLYEDGVEQMIASLQSPDNDVSIEVVSNGEGNLKAVLQDIAENERKLAELRTTYKDSYPEVVSLLTRLARLKEEQARLSSMMSLAGIHELPLLNSILAAAAKYDPAKNQAIVVIFDPRDKSIFWPESELHAVIRDSHMPIYCIAVQTEGEILGSTFLDILTEATGGRRFLTATWDKIPEIEDRIKIELQNQYTLTYTPLNTTQPGAYHKVEVRMTPVRGLPELHAHTRPGYY